MPKMKDGWIPKEDRTHLVCKDCKREMLKEKFMTEGFAPSGLRRYNARCGDCYRENLKKRRAEKQIKFVQTIKTECKRCMYSKCPTALEFHHIDPNNKDGIISEMVRNNRSIEAIRKEAEKCVVLCSNCHRELHYGIWNIEDLN